MKIRKIKNMKFIINFKFTKRVMEKSNRNADAQSVRSHASKASKAPSMTMSQREEAAQKAFADKEQAAHEERLKKVR